MKRVLAGFGCLAMVLAFTSVSAAPPPVAPKPAGFRIVSDLVLPAAFEWATDVRWASDSSVYLGLSKDGAVEMSLDPKGPPPKVMIPGASKPGGFWASHTLAASSQYLVATPLALTLTWRRIADPIRVEVPFEAIQGIDVRGDQVAIVGARRDDTGTFAPDGAIAWIGSLGKELTDLRPLLYDMRGPGARTMNRCLSFQLGAVRFLPDGSLVLVQGVQPGVNLYDDKGKLVRTWDTEALGIDTDCGSLSEEAGFRLAAHGMERHAWVNQRRTVNAVLPLPQGPGLVVRRVDHGRTRWDLKLLRRDGSVESHPIPLEGSTSSFHLRGDVRSGKIVFLLREALARGSGKDHPTSPRVIVAYPPGV